MVSIMGDQVGNLLDSHKDIWDFIDKYYRANKAVPPAEVVLDVHPDFEYQEDITGATKHYVDRLKSLRQKSEIKLLMAKVEESLEKGVSPEKLLQKISKKTTQIQRTTGVSRSIDVRDLDDALDHFDRVKQLVAQHDGRPGISFGYPEMDKHYPTGAAPGHLIVGIGYSGLGKTWFCISLMVNAWKQGYSPLIINLEMSPEDLRDRIYFLISHYSMTDLVRANIDESEFTAWAKDFMQGKAEFHLVGNDTFDDFSVDMVHAKVEQYRPDIILLDYASLFTDREHSQNETVRMKNLSRQLKQLATAMKIPIVLISAVTGKDKKDRVNPPDIAQVAWSSGIEYDANLAFAIHTHRNDKLKAEKTEIVCRKNRHGELFSFYVKMDLVAGTITEIPIDEQISILNGGDDLEYLDEDDDE
jgi:replicative DNA helicase